MSYRVIGLSLLLLCASTAAHAEDCHGTRTLGGCFASLGVTGPAESGPFRTLSLGNALPFGSLAVSVNAWHVSKPAELIAPSSDPAGRNIGVVSRATIVDLRAGFGLGRSLDLTLGLPVYVDIKGAGSDAIATQRPAALEGSALGDVRLGVRSTLLRAYADTLRLMLRSEWTLPTGDQSKYAGDGGVTSTTGLTAVFDSEGWAATIDAGYRAAPAVRFGDVRLGSAAILGLGIARDIIERHILSIGMEAWASRVLVDSPKTDMANDQGTTAIPAQWLVNVQLRPRDWQFWFWAGAGGALALSSRTTEHSTAFADAHFVAPSAARLRLGAGVGAVFDVVPGNR